MILILAIFACFGLAGSAFCQSDPDLAPVNKLAVVLEESQKKILDSASGSSGIMGFSWPGIIAGLIFSSVGMIAFMYGKKQGELKPAIIGMALMAYPYFVRNTVLIFVIGALLCGALYLWRE
jgi:hypothetical protein